MKSVIKFVKSVKSFRFAKSFRSVKFALISFNITLLSNVYNDL